MAQDKRRRGNISSDQKTYLLDFIEQHPKIKTGKFDATFTFKDSSNAWKKIADKLNSIAGAKKDYIHWRKVNFKNATKSKQAKTKKHQKGTGGGIPLEDKLTPIEERIAELIGTTALMGHSNILESHVEIVLPDTVGSTPGVDSENKFSSSENIELTMSELNDVTDFQETILNNSTDISLKENSRRRKPNVASQRLQNTICATSRLEDLSENKLNMKQSYLNKKLEYLNKNLQLKQRKTCSTGLRGRSYRLTK
ncbi:hypothetical protein CBL_10114 [Carabus blaptoides fortunei]